jgi:hypothetical protein
MNSFFIKKIIPDMFYIQLMYFYHKRKFVNFTNPRTFSEKQQWMKLYNRKSEYTIMADKFLVRDYIKEKLGEEYLIPLVGGPWSSVDDIDLLTLPEQFVLKCSNGHGVEICADKDQFNSEFAKTRLKNSMKNNLFWYSREWPYKNSKSVIIAEEYMQGDMIDYKFYCFNGIPKYLFIVTNRFTNDGPYGDFFDMEGNHLAAKDTDFPNNPYGYPLLPQSFEDMKKIAQVLSEGIPFVRIDLYEQNNKPIFGEITFFDSAGFSNFDPPEFDIELGKLIYLPTKKHL